MEKPPLVIGLALARSGTAPVAVSMEEAAKLAIAHVREAGGLIGGRQIQTISSADTETLPETSQRVTAQLLDEHPEIVGLVVTTGPEFLNRSGRPGTPATGAGVLAGQRKIPTMCGICSSPDLTYPGNQAVLGAEVTGVDATEVDLKAGTVVASGYGYRLIEDTNRQLEHLVGKIKAAGHTRVASVGLWNINSGAEMVRILRSEFGGAYLGTVVDAFPFTPFTGSQWTELVTAFRDKAPGPKNPSPACNSPIPFCNDFTNRADGQPDAVVAYLFVPQLAAFLRAFAVAYPNPSERPRLYFMFTAYSDALIQDDASAGMLGQEGISYGNGRDFDRFLTDLESATGSKTHSTAVSRGYDAVVAFALAAYATGLENPTPEQIKQALDTINDPNGVRIGYREIAKAKETFDVGGTINYEGVSGPLDWDLTNGVRSPYQFWSIVEQNGARMYEIRETVPAQ